MAENEKGSRWTNVAKIGDPMGGIGVIVTTKPGLPDMNGKSTPMFSAGLFRRGHLLCWLFTVELGPFIQALTEAGRIIDEERAEVYRASKTIGVK